MTTLTLTRTHKSGKAVTGTITIPVGQDAIVLYCIENDDFIIPEGTYHLTVTMSPKFGMKLPLVNGVPGRSGIRIHIGSKPEHSKGCILVTAYGKQEITDYVQKNTLRGEPVYLHIVSAVS